MKVVALISGGKDSCFNMLQCIAAGHEIVALANLRPQLKDELDSYMFQTVGHDVIDMYAEAMNLPLFRQYIQGKSLQQALDYEQTDLDEVEDLYKLLKHVKENLNFEAISVGAILSNYQRIRVENVCQRLGLVSLAYLWRRDQRELLNEMLECQIEAILIKVAALGLDPKKHLGKHLQNILPDLVKLEELYGINVCGEGGEYETMTLDCPLFIQRIILKDMKQILHESNPVAPVAYLTFNEIELYPKNVQRDMRARLATVPVKTPLDFCRYEVDAIPLSSCEDHCLFTGDLISLKQTPTVSQSNSGMIYIGGLTGYSVCDMDNVMGRLKDILEYHESSMESLLSVCIYVRDMGEYLEMNRIYGRYFQRNPPTRVCVQVPSAHSFIIEAAAAPRWVQRRALHVQSISHWAPANIGPYSQAVESGNMVYISGQIGLIPGSMLLPTGPNFAAECRLSLRHINRVLCAMDSRLSLENAVQVICFVTNTTWIQDAQFIWNETARTNVPVVYVVVSGLPRSALVEWQVAVFNLVSDQPLIRHHWGSTSEIPFDISVTECEGAKFLVCRISDMSANLSQVQLAYKEISKRFNRRFGIRIYYTSEIDVGWVYMFQSVVPETHALTCIPVVKLENNDKVIILAVET